METQRKDKPNTVQLGELVVAAFDNAVQYSTDPREVSRLATEIDFRRAFHPRHCKREPARGVGYHLRALWLRNMAGEGGLK